MVYFAQAVAVAFFIWGLFVIKTTLGGSLVRFFFSPEKLGINLMV